jgi:hypothetical protein
MSKSKTAIAEIKKLMVQFGFMADESVMASFKLEDNTILQASKLEAGEKIVKINEEFEQVALEDGSYRLVENFNIEVEGGEIKSVKQIFVSAKLIDGTEIKVEGDGLVVGAKVVVVTPDAEIPAPDGRHELEDGTKVETKDGVIVVVEEKMEENGEGEPMPEGEPKAKVSDEPVIEVEMLEMLKDFVKKMSEKMASIEEKVNEVESQFSSFKKEPAAKKIANGKTDFNKSINNDDAMESKLAMIAELRKNNK